MGNQQFDRRTFPPPTGRTLHLVPEPLWRLTGQGDFYQPEGFEDEGFIHTTHDPQVLVEVANRYYRDDPRPYLVLEIELARVAEPVRYDDTLCQYPHVYGPLNTSSIVAVRRINRREDGTFFEISEDGSVGRES